jgi:hypothetical protein
MVGVKTKSKINLSSFFKSFGKAADSKTTTEPFSPHRRVDRSPIFENSTKLQCLAPIQSISHKLNVMIEKGTRFDVGEQKFEVVGGEHLPEFDRQYLVANEKEVLCTLYQRLLVKHWFNDSRELLEEFAFDVEEREAIIAEQYGLFTDDSYFEAVRGTLQKWFALLLSSQCE